MVYSIITLECVSLDEKPKSKQTMAEALQHYHEYFYLCANIYRLYIFCQVTDIYLCKDKGKDGEVSLFLTLKYKTTISPWRLE